MKLKTYTKPKLDYKDIRIIEGLSKYSPRNILKISREIGIPESTIRYRIKSMIKRGVLRLYTNIYHTNIGLKKHVFIGRYNPLYKDNIYDFIDAYSPINMHRIYGISPMVYSVHILPPYKSKELYKYMDELVNLGILEDYKILHSTCFHNINPTTDWFDIISGDWIFGWDTIIEDIEVSNSDLPITLKDPDDFPILADKLDINILWMLEIDPTVTYTKLAKELGTTVQNIKYHYEEHIEKRFLIEDFDIQILRFDPRESVFTITLMEFTSQEALAKTANVFRNRPFSEILGKILSRNALLGIFYLPNKELWNLVNVLNDLVKVGILKDYEIYLAPANERGKAYTIPYTYFKGDRWEFPSLEYYLSQLYEKLNKVNAN